MLRKLVMATLVALSGCASSVSSIQSKTSAADGNSIRYYLPMARLRVQLYAGYEVEVPAGAKSPVRVVLTAVRADISTPPEIAPDIAFPYQLAFQPSARSDDHFCVALDSSGMISALSVSSADRSGDIVERIGETIATAVAGVPIGGVDDGHGWIKEVESAAPKRVYYDAEPFASVIFDPDNAEERAAAQDVAWSNLQQLIYVRSLDAAALAVALNEKLKGRAAEFAVDAAAFPYQNPRDRLPPLFALSGSIQKVGGGARKGGAYIRPLTQRAFILNGVRTPARQIFATMPDVAAADWFSFSRAMFVRKDITLKMQRGTVASVDMRKPSEALAIISLPLNVAGAVVETPARFFTAIGKSFKSETAAINAQAELLKARAEFEKARMGTEANVPAGTGAGAENPAPAAPSPPPALANTATCS